MHASDDTDRDGKGLSLVLETFGLAQHVSEPISEGTQSLCTHEAVNTLIISVVTVSSPEGFCVFLDLSVTLKMTHDLY